MLRKASWELRRKQRLLLPFATPVYQALCRSFSYTDPRLAAHGQNAVAIEDTEEENTSRSGTHTDPFEDRLHDVHNEAQSRHPVTQSKPEPGAEVDPFSANFLSRQHDVEPSTTRSKTNSRNRTTVWTEDDTTSISRSRRISDSINFQYFTEDSSAARTVGRYRADDQSADERPRGYALPRRQARGFNEKRWNDPESESKHMEEAFPDRQGRRYVERLTGMKKAWNEDAPNTLLFKCLGTHVAQRSGWRRKVLSLRSIRMPIIVLQLMIRRDILQGKDDKELLELLPRGEQRRTLIDIVASNGYSWHDIETYIYILDGATDQERCERFLAVEGHKPIWILHFLLRPAAQLQSISTLHELLMYCFEMYHGQREGDHEKQRTGNNRWKARDPMQSMDPTIFNHTLKFLAIHSMVLEPRLLVKVGDLAVQYITNMADWAQHTAKIYHEQCRLFNKALEVFSPSVKTLPPQWHRPMASYWEPQRRLLSMSSSLQKPLVVNKSGFRAVREVLAGLEKDLAEKRNSNRHAQSWPPYLEVGDGIDEMTEAEDNWSRSVSAGTLQQEEGYALNQQDRVLDILQGRSTDGTPTIQQRVVRPLHPNMSVWEASIRATRNAEEAWARFQRPPQPNAEPGVHEYAAMFTKLCTRDADPDAMYLPGDRALNFPVRRDPNLTEFALSRLQPPSVEQLYRDMRSEGIRPEGACLEVLVANAKSLSQVHQYLEESNEVVWPLMTRQPGSASSKSLRDVRTPVLAAYIRALCKLENRPGRELFRAVRLCDKRFEDDDASRVWAPYLWGHILKAFSGKTANFGRLSKTLKEQIRVYLQVVDRIEESSVLRRSVLVQLSKCLRKAASRALAERIRDLEGGTTASDSPLRTLYDMDFRQASAERMQGDEMGDSNGQARRSDDDSWLNQFSLGATRLRSILDGLVTRERESQELFESHGLASVEQLLNRRDPVLAHDAYEIMAAWAHLGEYGEMARYLEWLRQQWDNPEVLEQLDTYDLLPPYADFAEVLCLFRRYAEPMLSEDVVGGLRESIARSHVAWIWPDDEVSQAFAESREDASYRRLEHVLEWVRYRQARDRGEDPDLLLRPQEWSETSAAGMEDPSSALSLAYARPSTPLWSTSFL